MGPCRGTIWTKKNDEFFADRNEGLVTKSDSGTGDDRPRLAAKKEGEGGDSLVEARGLMAFFGFWVVYH